MGKTLPEFLVYRRQNGAVVGTAGSPEHRGLQFGEDRVDVIEGFDNEIRLDIADSDTEPDFIIETLGDVDAVLAEL